MHSSPALQPLRRRLRLILPGGFSYGDYLRAGAVAGRSPVVEALPEFVAKGGHVLGSCNGFQILCEAKLLPGALTRNECLQYRCQSTWLRAENTETPFTPSEMKTHPEYRSRLPANWDEDLLLPRIWDPNGHARGRMAPGGYIAQTDPDGKSWNMYTVGYRNCYDFDFNAAGDLFTYDSDTERDFFLPWYTPTRMYHIEPGGHHGWRVTGYLRSWARRDYYADTVDMLWPVGRGSPTGGCRP